jgi:hypothetical protein
MRLRRMTTNHSTHMDLHKPNKPNNTLVHSWSTFSTRMNHGQTRTHKIHHGPNLGKATTFPLIVYFVSGHETNTQMAFCPRTPKWESKIPTSWTPMTLGAHNFVCRPLIEMRSKEKFYSLSRAFQQYVACHLHTRNLERFSTFNGQESNCQFDSRPFFWP